VRTPLIRYPVVQYAYVVNDLDVAIRHWVEVLGAGPFYVSRNHRGREHTYRGVSDDAVFSYAFGQAGPAQVQLIQCMDDGPSVYRDMYPAGEEGFHHVACLVPAALMGAEVARFVEAGFEVASTLHSYVPVAYLDCRPALGFFVELHGLNDDVEELFTEIRVAHEQWDGVTDPIRVRARSSSLPAPPAPKESAP
jgi:hypothetical protein